MFQTFTVDKSLLGQKSSWTNVPWTTFPWTNVATPPIRFPDLVNVKNLG